MQTVHAVPVSLRNKFVIPLAIVTTMAAAPIGAQASERVPEVETHVSALATNGFRAVSLVPAGCVTPSAVLLDDDGPCLREMLAVGAATAAVMGASAALIAALVTGNFLFAIVADMALAGAEIALVSAQFGLIDCLRRASIIGGGTDPDDTKIIGGGNG
ncbi:MAG: hypothetical protein ACRENP_13510 [Longimicrobiales bacterium]